jgi:hypothetical protein
MRCPRGPALRSYPQAVSNLVWALGALAPASAGWAGRGWWEGLFLVTEERLEGYSSHGLANLAWGLGERAWGR